MTENNGCSIAEILAMTNNRGDGFLNGNGILIILFFLIFCGGFGGGFGGFGNAAAQGSLTRAELSQGFADNQMLNKLDGISNGICDSTYALTNSLNNGFNSTNMNITQGINSVNSNITNLGYQNQQCCCEIKNAIHSEGEATRQLIQQNTITALQDKLADKDRELQTVNFQLSQQAQSANLINQLRPFPTPSYITCSPYTSANGFGYMSNCCGCNCTNLA